MSAEDHYEEAKRRIAEARLTGAAELSLSRLTELDRLPPEIAELTQLTDLRLWNTSVADVSPLRDLGGLKNLALDQTRVSDLHPLENLAFLRSLSLSDTPVVHIRPLAELTALMTLFLSNTRIVDSTPLIGLHNLRTLWLNGTRITEISALAKLSDLELLDLSETPVTDIAPLGSLLGLTSLNLGNTPVRDISRLRMLTKLQVLILEGSDVLDLRPIRSIPFNSPDAVRALGLHFRKTPAAQANDVLARLSEISDDATRTQETRAYLRSLPPWPDPVGWERTPLPEPEPEPQSDQAGAGKTAQDHIAFILQTAAASEAIATVAADQIRAALNEVPVPHGSNRLPEPLLVFEDMAAVLDRLASRVATPPSNDGHAALAAEIAHLETLVEALTSQLADATTRAETAEAALAANPNWQAYKAALAPKAADMTIWLAKAGVISGTLHFLGTASPIAQALLGLLSRI